MTTETERSRLIDRPPAYNSRRCSECKQLKPIKGGSFRIVAGRGRSTCADCVKKRGDKAAGAKPQ